MLPVRQSLAEMPLPRPTQQSKVVAIKPAQNSTVAVASQPTITYSESSGEQSANKMLPNNKPTATAVTAPDYGT